MTFLHLMQRLLSLTSIALLALGLYLVGRWIVREQNPPVLEPGVYADPSNAPLWIGGALLAFSLLGRWPMLALLARKGDDAARRRGDAGERLRGADGSELHVERHGPDDAPALVFVHGWGLSGDVWWEAKRDLSRRYQVVTWDLPGLGRSAAPPHGRLSLEGFAADLKTVVDSLGGRSVVLVGWSIGGMILQTFARQYPGALGRPVAGLVLENTTHTDPTRTTFGSGFLQAIRPVAVGAMHADVMLQPLVWAMNWQSYLSGSAHLAMRIAGFGTRPTRAQLDQAALLSARNPPAVQAKGNLAMMRWDATDDLPRIKVPALVFVGQHDLVTRPRAGETICHTLPQARLVQVPKAGHMGPVERAEIYEKEILAFADEVFTRGARWADAAARPPEPPAPEPGRQRPTPPIQPPSVH